MADFKGNNQKMNIDHIVIYGTTALVVINIIINLGIFARSSDLKALEAKIADKLSKEYVQKDVYADNHKALEAQILQLQHDVSDVKSLLITAITELKKKC